MSKKRVDLSDELLQDVTKDMARLTKCKRYLAVGKQFQSAKKNVWDEAYTFIRGSQWRSIKPEGVADYVGNVMFSTIQSKIALLTDNNPIFNVVPTQDMNMEVQGAYGQNTTITALIPSLNNLLSRYGWEHWGIYNVVFEAGLDGLITGTGIAKVTYDTMAKARRGDVVVESIDPRYIVVSPDCSTDIQKAQFIIEKRIVNIDQLAIDYPDKISEIKADDLLSYAAAEKTQDSTKAGSSSTYSDSPVAGYPLQLRESLQYGENVISTVTTYELWERCLETEKVDVPITNPDTDEIQIGTTGEVLTEPVLKLKYPQGRRTVFTEDVLLTDGPIPYTHGLYPYAWFRMYTMPRATWGLGEYEMHHNTQRMINRITCNLIDWSNGAYNKHLLKTGNLKGKAAITDTAWEVLTLDDISGYQQVVAPPPPSGMFDLLSVLRQFYDLESGLNDVSRGRKPEGMDRVGVAMTLKDSDYTRMRPLIRGFETFIADIGELCIALILQFNRFDLDINYVGDENKIEQSKLLALAADTDIAFKVEVQSNSTIPKDKSANAAMALQLFSQGIIGQRTMLKAVEFPLANEALQEMDQMKQMQQQIEQLTQQMQQLAKQAEEQVQTVTKEKDKAVTDVARLQTKVIDIQLKQMQEGINVQDKIRTTQNEVRRQAEKSKQHAK